MWDVSHERASSCTETYRPCCRWNELGITGLSNVNTFTIQALKKCSFMNGEPSAYFSTSAMSIKYDTSGDMFTVRVYSFPEGKRDAQCEMILMNEDEGQVAQRLTTLAADGINLESRVCR